MGKIGSANLYSFTVPPAPQAFLSGVASALRSLPSGSSPAITVTSFPLARRSVFSRASCCSGGTRFTSGIGGGHEHSDSSRPHPFTMDVSAWSFQHDFNLATRTAAETFMKINAALAGSKLRGYPDRVASSTCEVVRRTRGGGGSDMAHRCGVGRRATLSADWGIWRRADRKVRSIPPKCTNSWERQLSTVSSSQTRLEIARKGHLRFRL
jgi:hypothetical protein